jgi:hypothetical protein
MSPAPVRAAFCFAILALAATGCGGRDEPGQVVAPSATNAGPQKGKKPSTSVISLKALQSKPPAGPFQVCGECWLEDQFPAEFRDMAWNYHQIRLKERESGLSLNCYVFKKSEAGAELAERIIGRAENGKVRILECELIGAKKDGHDAKILRVVSFN